MDSRLRDQWSGCALGEAINGPGGYFGWNADSLERMAGFLTEDGVEVDLRFTRNT